MTADEFRALTAHDERLTVGHPVTVRWTTNHRSYAAPGHVVQVHAKSVLVALDVAIRATSPADRTLANADGIIYPAGHVITAPRITAMRRWTANHCTTDAELDRACRKETV
jgi:hypothetical protein